MVNGNCNANPKKNDLRKYIYLSYIFRTAELEINYKLYYAESLHRDIFKHFLCSVYGHENSVFEGTFMQII